MAGTKAGGAKAAKTNKQRDPDFYKKIGAVGGSRGRTGGFYSNRDLAREAGKKGGTASRRGSKLTQEEKRRVLEANGYEAGRTDKDTLLLGNLHDHGGGNWFSRRLRSL